MYWKYGTYVFPLLGAGLIMTAVGVLAFRRRQTPGAGAFSLLAFALVVWCVGNVLEIGCLRFEDKLFWANIEYLSIAIIPASFLAFAAQYTTSGKRPKGVELLALGALSAPIALLVWRDPAWGLVRRDLALVHVGEIAVLSKTFGPWFWVHIVYTYLALVFGSILLVRRQLRYGDVFRGQALSVVIGICFPWVANILYITFRLPSDYLDPTPMLSAISGAALAFGLFRYRLFDIVPAARDAVIEGLPDGIIVFDATKRIVDVNPAALSLLGRELDDVMGRLTDEALGPDLNVADLASLDGKTTGQLYLGEGERRRYCESRISPLVDRRRRVVGGILTLRDVTQQKRLEERLRQTQTMEAVGTLAGGVAHHFNNLLTVINGYSQLLLSSLSEDDALRSDVEVIHHAGSRAAEITRRLLVFGRDHGPGQQVCDVNDIVNGMSDMLPLLIAENIELRLELSQGIGKVKVDPRLLEEAIVHLVANARDAMPDGGVLTISTVNMPAQPGAGVSQKPSAGSVGLVLSDTGVGITAEVKEHLFQPFFTTKGLARSTGLGLSTVYGIVHQWGGSIQVSSEPGQGSAFLITLPRVDSSALDSELPSRALFAAPGAMMSVVADEKAIPSPAD
ncbi:MAG: histidine kinase N-terminal 7TM domain-containing protein [Anaerolineae bacterium]